MNNGTHIVDHLERNRTRRTVRTILDEPRNGMNEAYQHRPFYSFFYSDGVKELVTAAGCVWLLDILATEVAMLYRKRFKNQGTAYVEMVVADQKATIVFRTSDEGPPAWTRQIDYTDFPEGVWKPLFEIGPFNDRPDQTIAILPSEH